MDCFRQNAPLASGNEDLATVERFIEERRAGFKPDENELSPVQYEGVLVWDSINAQYENAYQQTLLQMLGGLFGGKK